MAADPKDQGSSAKDKIAKGMDEAGKGQVGKAGDMPKTGAGGSKDLAKGMSESGSGAPTGEGDRDKDQQRR